MNTLARKGQAPVSTDQGLTLSQQSGCMLYVETSSRSSPKSVISAFEVAALAKFGPNSTHHHASRNMSMSLVSLGPKLMPPPVPPKPLVPNYQHRISPPVPPKPRRAISTLALNQPLFLDKENYNYVSQHHLDQPQPLSGPNKLVMQSRPSSASKSNLLSHGSSPRLNFKTSKERSMSSLLSLSNGHYGRATPRLSRKNGQANDKTVTIKCQRLNAEKQYEEVDVEVPAPIYDTLRFYNSAADSSSASSSGLDTTSSRGSRHSTEKTDLHVTKNKTFTSKIRSLFGKSTT